jgi:hypothetical protein
MPEVQYPKPLLYVAGASAEIDAIEKWIRALEQAGFQITFDWTKQVRHLGEANPREASWEDRYQWMTPNRDGVLRAQFFWLLIPSGGLSVGCWVEYGMAVKSTFNRPVVFISGDVESTIFSAAADHRFSTHDEAYYALCKKLQRRHG